LLALFTDFGADDIYVGQMKVALLRHAAADTHILDVLHEVPNFDARAGAHLLAALRAWYPDGTVFLCVVDPGVGSERGAVVVQADSQWFVGPDNGLLSVVAARASRTRTWRATWRPAGLSASFHGRDLFAPMAAWVSAAGDAARLPIDKLEEVPSLDVQFGEGDLAEVIYVDHYGNVLTGLRANALPTGARLRVGSTDVGYARVFSDVVAGQAFWYVNSIGLVEIAMNRGSAAALLGVRVGDVVRTKV
jgi:S-adenosylmethionine hydrolase